MRISRATCLLYLAIKGKPSTQWLLLGYVILCRGHIALAGSSLCSLFVECMDGVLQAVSGLCLPLIAALPLLLLAGGDSWGLLYCCRRPHQGGPGWFCVPGPISWWVHSALFGQRDNRLIEGSYSAQSLHTMHKHARAHTRTHTRSAWTLCPSSPNLNFRSVPKFKP